MSSNLSLLILAAVILWARSRNPGGSTLERRPKPFRPKVIPPRHSANGVDPSTIAEPIK